MDHLQEAGYSAEDVTRVILSHLDADHVGWALEPRASPTPPSTCRRTRSRRLGRCRRATDAEKRSLPSRRESRRLGRAPERERRGRAGDQGRGQVRAPAGHQIAWIGDGDDAALYTADLAPAKIWLDPDLISGVDTDPEAARRNRIEVLEGRGEWRDGNPLPRARRLPRQDPAHREGLQGDPARASPLPLLKNRSLQVAASRATAENSR